MAAVGLLVIVTIAYRVVSTVKVSGPLYADIIRGKDLVADILPPPEYIIESYLVAYQAGGETRPGVRQQYLALSPMGRDLDGDQGIGEVIDLLRT